MKSFFFHGEGKTDFSRMRDYIFSDLSVMTEFPTESARYAKKALLGWHSIHAPGDWKNHCCVPVARYLSSGSEDKVINRRIARIFINLVAQ